MIQRPAAGVAVFVIDFGHDVLFRFAVLFQHTGGHGGHQRQCDDQTGQQGVAHGQRQIGEQFPGDAVHEHDGQEHTDGGQCGGRDGAGHLPGTGHRRLNGIGAVGAQPVDVLNDHHRVVHKHTHGDGQAGQGDDIQRHPGEVHEHDGKHQTQGDGAQGDEGGADIPEEQEQNQDGKQRAESQTFQNGADDQIDVVPLVHQGIEFQPLIF